MPTAAEAHAERDQREEADEEAEWQIEMEEMERRDDIAAREARARADAHAGAAASAAAAMAALAAPRAFDLYSSLLATTPSGPPAAPLPPTAFHAQAAAVADSRGIPAAVATRAWPSASAADAAGLMAMELAEMAQDTSAGALASYEEEEAREHASTAMAPPEGAWRLEGEELSRLLQMGWHSRRSPTMEPALPGSLEGGEEEEEEDLGWAEWASEDGWQCDTPANDTPEPEELEWIVPSTEQDPQYMEDLYKGDPQLATAVVQHPILRLFARWRGAEKRSPRAAGSGTHITFANRELRSIAGCYGAACAGEQRRRADVREH